MAYSASFLDELREHTRLFEAIATFVLGNPNPAHSTRSQWRYGTNGSVSVEVAGPKAGAWYDHEAEEGGGPWELLRRKLADADIADWLASNLNVHLERAGGGHIVAVYPYKDENGRLLYEVCRLAPKRFMQRRPNREWGIPKVRRVLYRLPELRRDPQRRHAGRRGASQIVQREGCDLFALDRGHRGGDALSASAEAADRRVGAAQTGGEDPIFPAGEMRQLFEDLDRDRRQMHEMAAAVLGPLARQRPDLLVKIELAPSRERELVAALRG
jgi:hypothetical protein